MAVQDLVRVNEGKLDGKLESKLEQHFCDRENRLYFCVWPGVHKGFEELNGGDLMLMTRHQGCMARIKGELVNI